MPGLYFDSGIDKGFEKDLQRLNNQYNKFSNNVEGQNTNMTKSYSAYSNSVVSDSAKMQSSFKQLGTAVAAYFGTQQLVQFAKSVVETTAEFEKFGIVLENTLGSASAAEDALAVVSDFAAETPFSVRELTESFVKLTNQGFQPTREELVKLGDLASSTGKGFDQLSEAIIDAQVGEFERLKEFGIRASKSGDDITFAFKGVETTVKNTEANIRRYILSLGDLEGVQGANAKIAASLSGKISNIGDAWDKLLVSVGQDSEGAINYTLDAIKNLIDNWETVAEVLKQVILTYGVYKASVIAVNQVQKVQAAYSRAFGKEAKLNAVQEQRAKQQSIILEKQKQQELIKSATIIAQTAKAEISALNLKIQAQRQALSQAIVNKNLTAARAAQEKLANLEAQRAIATTAKKTATQNIANAAIKTNTLQTNLNAVATKRASLATKAFSKVSSKLTSIFKANPIGIIVTGLSLAIPLIKEFTAETSTAVKVQNAINEVNAEAGKSIAGQKVQLDQLLEIARDETQSLQDREAAIKELNKVSPEFLGQLNLQTINTKEAEAATKAYTESLLRNARAQAAQAKLVQIEQELIDLQTQAQVESSTRWQQFVNGVTNAGDAEGYLEAQRNSEFQNAVKRGRELIAIRKELTKTIIEGAGKEILLNKNKTQDGGGTKGTKDSIKAFEKLLQQQKKAYQDYNKDIEGLSGKRLETVQKEYKGLIDQGNTYLDFLNNLLGEETNAKKQTIIKREIDVTTLKNTILEQKAAEELFKKTQEDLATLEEAYRTYSQKRNDIETEFNAKILKLRKAGFTAQAVQAQKALDVELRRLEDSILSQNALFKEWVSEDLPKIAKTGVEALRKELDNIQIALETEGLAPEQVLAYQKQIDILKKKLKEKLAIEKESPQTWKDTLELMNGLNTLLSDTINSIGGLSESTQNLLTGVSESVTGFINMAQAIKAVGVAGDALETASGIVALISTALKVVFALLKATKNASEIRQKAQIDELINIKEINIELIKQNALYKAGNEFFASDKWGTALAGLDAYNTALGLQEENYQRIAAFNADLGNTDPWGGQADAARVAQARVELYATAVGKALALIQVRTKDRSKFNIFQSDDYKGLLEVYPDLINANGRLNTSILETVIATADVSDANRELLTGLLETTEAAEEAYGQFGDYISGIFGGVADDITKAFQVMYESSQLGIDETIDAMKSLEVSFSEMIESFTRDAIEFAFLSPYLNELNEATKALGEQYASGAISADELQQGVIGTLGGFYDQMAELQPTILQAFQNADELTAAAGFESAFNPEDINIETPADTDIEIPDAQVETNIVETVSTPGAITQAITEETGTILSGRIGALVLSNEKILLANNDMLDYAVQHLTYMKQIKLNTDYLPAIAENTRKTYEKLDSV